MRILLTGATGRVGSRVAPRLIERGDSVRILVRDPQRAEALGRAGAEIAVGDLSQPETLAPALAQIDAVVHLAALFRGADAESTRAVTADGTIALAQAAAQAGVAQFIFTSTNLIYGPGYGRPDREDDQPQPQHAYPISKVAAERALAELRDQLHLSILRLAFVYGEGDPHLAEGLAWFRQWHPDKRMHMIHHADVAQAIVLALDTPGASGRIYNVADDEPVSAATVLRMFGEPIAADAAARPLGDPWEGIADTTRIRAELGFRPIYPTLADAQAADAL